MLTQKICRRLALVGEQQVNQPEMLPASAFGLPAHNLAAQNFHKLAQLEEATVQLLFAKV